MTVLSGEILDTIDGKHILLCMACKKQWTREAQGGRPPKYCDDCRGRKIGVPMPFKPKPQVPEKRDHHNEFNTLLAVAEARVPVMCVGPAGSGKTTAARQVAKKLDLSFVAKPCNPQMSEWDIYGFTGADGVTFKPGIVYHAFRDGGVVLLDEIDASNPAVLVAINIIASARVGEEVTFPNGENVKRHPDFILIAGANTYGDGASDDYVGREQLDAATLDRFAVIDWGYDEPLEFMAAGDDAVEWVKFVQRVRKAAEQAKVDMLVTPRASINGAVLLRKGMKRQVVEALTVWKGMSPDALNAVKKQLEKLDAEERRKEQQERQRMRDAAENLRLQKAEQEKNKNPFDDGESQDSPDNQGDQKGNKSDQKQDGNGQGKSGDKGDSGNQGKDMTPEEAVQEMRKRLNAMGQEMRRIKFDEKWKHDPFADLRIADLRVDGQKEEFIWDNKRKIMRKARS